MNMFPGFINKILKNDLLVLAIIFCIGLALRLYNLTDNFIFGYDQARDAQRIYDLLYLKDIKLVGPETDIPGIFHGALYYYLIAPVYYIFKFDPNYVAVFLSIINLFGIFIVYYAGKILFNKNVGLIAALFFAFSYEQASYSRFISNPSPMSVSTGLFFLGLALFIFKKKDLGLLLSSIGFAVSVHLNFFMNYLIIFYPVLFYMYRPKLTKKGVTVSLLAAFLILSPFLLAEIRFGFSGIKSFVTYVGHQTEQISIMESTARYIDKTVQVVYNSFFSFNFLFAFFAFIFSVIICWKQEKQKDQLIFVLIWIFSTAPLFAFRSGVHNTPWLSSALIGGFTLLFSLTLLHVSKIHSKWIIAAGVFLVLFSNLNLFKKDSYENVKIFEIQRILYKDVKNVADFTYESSGKEPFSICSVSNPLFINTTWSFIYSFYGKNKYGYMPFWSGQQQYLNRNLLSYDRDHVEKRYLILEPQGGIPDFSQKATIYMEDTVSVLEGEREIGKFKVQKRRLAKTPADKLLLKDTQDLPPDIKANIEKTTIVDPRYTCYNSY